MKIKGLIIGLLALLLILPNGSSQTTVRERPAEWNNLVYGGRFMDLFLPMPTIGKLTSDTWGAANVVPRDIKNGIESTKYSIWGGNIVKGDDGKYHLLACGWLENSPRGHMTWRNSIVFHTVSDNLSGPYTIADTIGKGHNPEVYRLKDGRYVLYVIDGYYVASTINGPWTPGKFEFRNRDMRIIDGLSNLTFAQHEDGSFLMVNHGGGIWFSQTGLSPYNQVSEERVYPKVEGAFEDPLVWRDNVQYNLIVNDWLGRIAFHLRSKDGVTWIIDPGEAYIPGISKHADGSVEEWFKYERIKVFQDTYGRAIQANFAVIDTLKNQDKGNDNHSSKNITIPLTVPRLLTILDKKPLTSSTKTIRIKIDAESGFNPDSDIDIKSLKFGPPAEVDFGRGGTVVKTEKSGNDLIITFNTSGLEYPENEYAAKLLGKTTDGKLLFGYARLPWVDFIEPVLSARLPQITASDKGFMLKIEVENFGQIASKTAAIKVMYLKDEKEVEIASGKIGPVNPFQKTTVDLNCGKIFESGVEYNFIVIINPDSKNLVKLHGKLIHVKRD